MFLLFIVLVIFQIFSFTFADLTVHQLGLKDVDSGYRISFDEVFQQYGQGMDKDVMYQRFIEIDKDKSGFLEDHEFEGAYNILQAEVEEVEKLLKINSKYQLKQEL